MAKNTPRILGEAPSGPKQHGKPAKQGTMTNTKVSRSGGPKPSVTSLEVQTRGPRDNGGRN